MLFRSSSASMGLKTSSLIGRAARKTLLSQLLWQLPRNIATVATEYRDGWHGISWQLPQITKSRKLGRRKPIVQKGRKGKATEGWFYRPVLKIRFRNLFPQISRIIINGVWTFLEGRLKFFNELLEFIEYTFDKFVSFVENHNDWGYERG